MMFEDILEEAAKNVTQNEASKAQLDDYERETRWKQKRIGKITSSKLPDLMKSGKGKGDEWGETAKTAMLAVLHERMTKVERPNYDLPQFRWGHENEPLAIEEYNKRYENKLISGSTGFDEILFFESDGFGDSPDAISEDGTIVAEIKCPENGVNHLRFCSEKVIHDKSDYYWQMLGHLLANGAKEMHFISFDPRFEDNHPLKLHVVIMKREDYEKDILKLKARIETANKVINMALEANDPAIILNINNLKL
jgi:hypothetical protein